MKQINSNFIKVLKGLNTDKKGFLALSNEKEVIEKVIIKLYNNELKLNELREKPLKKSSIYQKWFKSIRAYSRDLGKPLYFRINKTPKNPQNLMKNTNTLENFNLDSKPIREIMDYNKIFTEIKTFMTKLEKKSLKWFNFLSVKICSGLDYTDIVGLKLKDLKELNGFGIISKYRNKTQCENFSILTAKSTINLKNYIKTLNLKQNDLIFPSNDNKIAESNKQMNSNSITETIKRIMNDFLPSKKLRAITNQILNEFGKLSILEKDFYSKIWLGHKIQTHNVYTDKLRNPKFFLTEYLENYEKFFNQLI